MKIIKYNLKANIEITIAHFSDIHYSIKYEMKKFDKILTNLKKIKPNYICITGDIVDNIGIAENSDLMKTLYNFFEELGLIAKVLVTLGNHDIRKYHDIENNKWYLNLKKIKNIILLDNENYIENDICFYGFTAKEEYYCNEYSNINLLIKDMNNIVLNKQTYNILLIHSPIHLDNELIYEKIKNFNLILAGHTHNGLTPHFFKGNFALCTPSHKFFAKNARNSFKNKEIPIIISGGITKLSRGTGLLHFFDQFYKSDLNYIRLK